MNRPMTKTLPRHRAWIGIVYFLVAATPGFWFPIVTNILNAQGWSHIITWTFLIPPLVGMISPLIFAARADQHIHAEKLLAGVLLAGSCFLFLAFQELERGLHPERFLIFLALNALITAPAWSLLTTITLTYVDTGKGSFGLFRVWATLGWMAAGWIVSSQALDSSPTTGHLAVGTRVIAALCCLMLPSTPPRGKATGRWQDAFGLSALKLMRDRDVAVFLITSSVFSIPLAAFYMHTPPMLKELGVERVAAVLTIGQATEVFAILGIAFVMRKVRIKWLLLFALFCGLARYVLYAIAAHQHSVTIAVIGIGFHGLCWTFFYEAGRIFLDKKVSFAFRNQIQALMGMFSGCIGSLVGTLLCGALYDEIVLDDISGWPVYWGLLSGLIVLCIIGFLLGYKGNPPGQAPQADHP
ncbi:MAG: MFS family permease [Kiritimatiellia bacterium]|jgi:MFS family permease